MSVTLRVKRLPHGEGLPLPSYQSTHAAGLDLVAGVPEAAPVELAPGARALIERERTRLMSDGASPWDAADAFQFSGERRLALPLVADGEAVVAEIAYGPQGAAVTVGGEPPVADAVTLDTPEAVYVLRRGRQTRVALRDLALDRAGDTAAGGLVRAPMHGKVLAVLVTKGDTVVRGQRVAIIEAMKMEHTLTAPIDGTVSEIAVVPDVQVAEGATILLVDPLPATP